VIKSTRSIERLIGAGIAVLIMGASTLAQDKASARIPTPTVFKRDSGDVAWMLTSSALVLMMRGTGMALLY